MAKSNNQNAVISLIVRSLHEKPILVAIFGICVLGFFVTSATLAFGNLKSEEKFPFFITFFVFLVGGLLSALLASKEKPIPIPPVPVPPPVPIDGLGPFENMMAPIIKSMKSAKNYHNELFIAEIEQECHAFGANAADWAHGQLSVPPSRYDIVLLKLYEHAKQSVFCTSFKDYRSTWESPLGRLVMEAHRKSSALVTRVFVFDVFNDITDADVSIMQSMEKQKNIKVVVYIDKEYPLFDFPPDITRDFTLIDGKAAIGITASFGPGKLAADWFFENDAKFLNLSHVRESVLMGGKPLDEFLSRWKKDGNAGVTS